MISINKKENNFTVVVSTIPYDTLIEEKEKGKVSKYQVFTRELQKLWNIREKLAPIVTGDWGYEQKTSDGE